MIVNGRLDGRIALTSAKQHSSRRRRKKGGSGQQLVVLCSVNDATGYQQRLDMLNRQMMTMADTLKEEMPGPKKQIALSC